MYKPIISSGFLEDGPVDLQKMLGKKAKILRLHYGYKRTTLSEKSGVSPETIRNFEQSGKITLANFLKIAFALDESNKLGSLFELPEVTSISDIESRQQPLPKRGRR